MFWLLAVLLLSPLVMVVAAAAAFAIGETGGLLEAVFGSSIFCLIFESMTGDDGGGDEDADCFLLFFVLSSLLFFEFFFDSPLPSPLLPLLVCLVSTFFTLVGLEAFSFSSS